MERKGHGMDERRTQLSHVKITFRLGDGERENRANGDSCGLTNTRVHWGERVARMLRRRLTSLGNCGGNVGQAGAHRPSIVRTFPAEQLSHVEPVVHCAQSGRQAAVRAEVKEVDRKEGCLVRAKW